VTGTTGMRPDGDIAGCAASHEVLLARLDGLDDATAARSSLLPGWTVGHVLTHLARNADSHVRRFDGAARGEVVDQYPGGYEGRAADIEAGAHRGAAELLYDLRASIDAFAAACAALPPDAWAFVTRDVGGVGRAAADLPLRRWQEIEVHHVDLGLGYGPRDWPGAFVDRRLRSMLEQVPGRLPPGAAVPVFDGFDRRDVLAWCYDRAELPGLPRLSAWG
jgi:maleylpyruvate isomerase